MTEKRLFAILQMTVDYLEEVAMKSRRLVIARPSMAALLTVVVALALHGSAKIYAQDAEEQTGIGMTGRVGFAISFESVSPAEKTGVKGFIVESVEPGSRADKAGIKSGDIILSLSGRRIQSRQDVKDAFRSLLDSPNLTVNVVYLRYDPATRRFMFAKTGQMNMVTSSGAAISGGILDGKANEKPLPTYPAVAKAVRASGTVTVSVLINEEGRIEMAEAVSGHPLLREAAVEAAYYARFTPTKQSGKPVKVTGVITYNFALP